MPIAVGVIETQTFPAILAAADAMVKAGRVTIVVQDRSESGRQFVAIRGPVSEVKQAMAAGLIAADACPGFAEVTSHYIVPNPPENLEAVLPIAFSEDSEPFWV
ncbi:MAG: carbon dioxide-concentrating mechanism protein CcmK [Leptolyngbyaceae cyanobacterium SM1_1_3]|nr:carbon dioxide-concentrating mechanism protein CcmK [Leptolyngbyaceae cyanobacterium SM1_1_3]NJN02335.1 carbon dioxide-concentrating mechanism protein CcmK [Leptolyngbyaceae cyanobacterium RM1_1_2]NJO11734.1 carbon dioxide-concentrating mechanism protein CcmK [Leptolyngbyaceae cyanobacterium SL_1_1]